MNNQCRRKRKKKKRTSNGSYTLEAAFFFPLYLSLIVAFFIIGFFLYDKVVLLSTASYYAKNAIHTVDEPVSIAGEMETWRLEEQGILRISGYADSFSEKEVGSACEEKMKERLFLAEIEEVTCKLNDGKVTISYEATFQAPILCSLLSLLGVSTEIKGTASASREMSPEEFVRIVRGILWREDADK